MPADVAHVSCGAAGMVGLALPIKGLDCPRRLLLRQWSDPFKSLVI